MFIRLSGRDKLSQQDAHSLDRMSRSSEFVIVLAEDPVLSSSCWRLRQRHNACGVVVFIVELDEYN